jgi:hypothetical protein
MYDLKLSRRQYSIKSSGAISRVVSVLETWVSVVHLTRLIAREDCSVQKNNIGGPWVDNPLEWTFKLPRADLC